MLSLREDALGLLDVFKESIPNVFSNHLRLDRLDRDAARAAILGPVERWNELFAAGELVTVEPELVEDVLGQASSGVEKSRIEPPYLQLVMEHIWNEERERGSTVLRRATLAEVGGATAIVREHLDRALSALDEDTQEAAARMFAEDQRFMAELSRLREPLVGVDFVDERLLVRGRSGRTYVIDPRLGDVRGRQRRGPREARSADATVVAVARGRRIDIRRAGRRSKPHDPGARWRCRRQSRRPLRRRRGWQRSDPLGRGNRRPPPPP